MQVFVGRYEGVTENVQHYGALQVQRQSFGGKLNAKIYSDRDSLLALSTPLN